jgi:hypothetical protein
MRLHVSKNACRAVAGCLVVLALATPSLGRKWRTINNLLMFDAELLSYDGKKAKFQVAGGGDFTLPLEKLSEEDRQYLKTTYPDGLKQAKKDEPKPGEKPADEPAPPTPAVAPKVAAATRPIPKTPSAAEAASAGGLSVEVVSITVTKPPKDPAQTGLMTPGTHFTLLVSDPKRTISGLDSEKSKITACVDDKRTNLAQPPEGEAAAPGMLMLEVQPGGTSGTIELAQPSVPDPKATRILIRGELYVICGEGDAAETVKVPLNIVLGLGL